MIPVLFAQRIAFGTFGLSEMLVALIFLGAVWAIFNIWVTLPPKGAATLNVVVGCVVAVIAIRFLIAFLF